MMETWVLIIWMFGNPYARYDGAGGLAAAKFDTKHLCLAALSSFRASAPRRSAPDGVCVPASVIKDKPHD